MHTCGALRPVATLPRPPGAAQGPPRSRKGHNRRAQPGGHPQAKSTRGKQKRAQHGLRTVPGANPSVLRSDEPTGAKECRGAEPPSLLSDVVDLPPPHAHGYTAACARPSRAGPRTCYARARSHRLRGLLAPARANLHARGGGYGHGSQLPLRRSDFTHSRRVRTAAREITRTWMAG